MDSLDYPDNNDMEEPVFSTFTIKFAKVAVEFCAFVENTTEYSRNEFIDKAVKLLPLLYLDVSIIPELEEYYDSNIDAGISENRYMMIRNQIADVLGEDDLYLETFHPDMPFSDSPVAVKISEDLADIYQDLGNFIAEFQHGLRETMNDALFVCVQNFREYWGQKLLNALGALHHVKYKIIHE